MTDAHTTTAGDALCRLKANLPHQFLPDLFEVIKEYDLDIDRHMKTIHKKDDHLRTADKEIAALRAENARLRDYETAAGLLAVEKAELRRESDNAFRIAAEYLEAQRVIQAGPPQPDSGFASPRSWRHNDPEVIRWHKAVAALNELASKVKP